MSLEIVLIWMSAFAVAVLEEISPMPEPAVRHLADGSRIAHGGAFLPPETHAVIDSR